MKKVSKNLKISAVFVGAKVGKTSFLLRLRDGEFPSSKYLPKFAEGYTININESYSVSVKDFPSYNGDIRISENLEPPKAFENANIFILMFDLSNPNTLIEVRNKYYNEIKPFCNINKPIILVGCKKDLIKNKLKLSCDEMEILATAKKIGAFSYVPCSSFSGEGMNDVMEDICKAVLYENEKKIQKKIQKKKIKKGLFGINKFFRGKKNGKIKKIVLKKENTPISAKGKWNWDDVERVMKQKNESNVKELMAKRKKFIDEASKSFKNDGYENLSTDVIRYILNEFVYINFETMMEFNSKSVMYLKELGISKNNALLHFFGRFSGSKEVIQLFFSFEIHSYDCMKFVPRRRNILICNNEKSRELFVYDFKEMYKKNVPLKKIYNIGVVDFLRLKESVDNLSELVMKSKKDDKNYMEVGMERISQLKNLEVFELSNQIPFGIQRISMTLLKFQVPNVKCLKKLVLDNIFHSDVSFSKLENLEYLKIRSNKNQQISRIQIDSIFSLKKLTKLYFYSMLFTEYQEFNSKQKYFWNKIGLEELVLHECLMDYSALSKVILPSLTLKTFAIILISGRNTQIPKDFLHNLYSSNIGIKYYIDTYTIPRKYNTPKTFNFNQV